MAQAAGERLGPVCSLTDQSTPYFNEAASFGALKAAGASAPGAQSAVPLQPGTQQESAQITLVYALEQGHARA
jgi:uncharacterized protein YggE